MVLRGSTDRGSPRMRVIKEKRAQQAFFSSAGGEVGGLDLKVSRESEDCLSASLDFVFSNFPMNS